VSNGENPVEVSLTLYIVNKQKIGSNNPKSPDPSVSILDHTLFFDGVCEDFTMTIYDGDGLPAYTELISSTTTQMNLPGTLSGNYELRLETDDLYYVGYIDF
jgi:hypothetical protein